MYGPGMPSGAVGCWVNACTRFAACFPATCQLLAALPPLPVRLCSILNDQAAQLSNELEASQDTIRVS